MPSPYKIFNDPVHGFVEVPRGLLLQLIDHPVVQRLRHIKQMGMTALVYPGAVHTRFNHALGAMHLMTQALTTLRGKGVAVSDKEFTAAQLAILLHDIGHGPFSHGLEGKLLPGVHHEEISLALMERLSEEFRDEMQLAVQIFRNEYPRGFFHQLVSSQLDMDRMDYLMRDSFFTGVQEGVVGADRIIKTLQVRHDRLVVEEKGIYSVEKFIVARRLMYWQVYLHKTALCAEKMVGRVLDRARELLHHDPDGLAVAEPLRSFLRLPPQENLAEQEKAQWLSPPWLDRFVQLTDTDLQFALQQWQHADDPVLADLCQRLMQRRLLKITLQREPFSPKWLAETRHRFRNQLPLPDAVGYYVFSGQVSNLPYLDRESPADTPVIPRIDILMKTGELRPITEAADMANLRALAERVTKYYAVRPAY